MKIGAIFIIRFILMRQYNNVDIVYSLISQLCVLDADCLGCDVAGGLFSHWMLGAGQPTAGLNHFPLSQTQ